MVFCGPRALAQLPAFPGAEGEGKWSDGGRGGDVYHVTNLNDTGAGSFRYGLDSASGPRTIVFDVSGTITANTKLRADTARMTIAGQTAPGMGIVIRNFGIALTGGDTIMRHMRVRPGDAIKGPDPKFNDFAIAVDKSDMIVDHCSTSWAISQEVTVDGANFNHVTVSNCIMGEGLDQAGLYHGEWNTYYDPGQPGHHANGLFVKPLAGGVPGNHSCTAIGNLLVDNHNRNPCPGVYNTSQSVTLDFVNNVIYNCRSTGYNSGDTGGTVRMNYVGNYMISGPSTDSGTRAFDANGRTSMFVYQTANKRDTDKDKDTTDGVSMSWSSFQGTYTQLAGAVVMEPVTTLTADQAYTQVLAQSGAFYWNRDSVDTRLLGHVTSRTGDIIDSQTEVDGYPVIPSEPRPAAWDTDTDGMPGYWETWYGTNPAAADQNGIGALGYTHLERYLEWILNPASIAHIGDANADGAVNVGDLGILAANWNQPSGGAYSKADYNGDGTVNVGDLGILAAQWGWSGSIQPTPPASAPEPGVLSLLALGALAMLRRRRR
jgi:MYXO-CTERM domain-containing protein